MKILVIGAHPDDEVLGVGGTIKKHSSQSDDVYVCIVTKTYYPPWPLEYQEKKKIEEKKVDQILNIKKRYHLNLPTVKLNIIPHGELNEKLNKIIDDIKPDIIYTHYKSDLNYDHTLVFKACLVATRPPKNINLICFETLSETEWNICAFQPNYWVDIKDHIKDKIDAFKLYKSEVKEYPHPRSPEGIRILAKKRGSEACIEYAEAFLVIRDYWI